MFFSLFLSLFFSISKSEIKKFEIMDLNRTPTCGPPCLVSFASCEDLLSHARFHEFDASHNYECYVCHVNLSSYNIYRQHIYNNHFVKPLSIKPVVKKVYSVACKVKGCNVLLSSSKEMRTHCYTHLNEKTENGERKTKTIECPFLPCTHPLSNSSSAKSHFYRKHDNDPDCLNSESVSLSRHSSVSSPAWDIRGIICVPD